jgi:hypothetical protein
MAVHGRSTKRARQQQRSLAMEKGKGLARRWAVELHDTSSSSSSAFPKPPGFTRSTPEGRQRSGLDGSSAPRSACGAPVPWWRCSSSMVKGINPHAFVKAYSAHLKRSGKVTHPALSDPSLWLIPAGSRCDFVCGVDRIYSDHS